MVRAFAGDSTITNLCATDCSFLILLRAMTPLSERGHGRSR